MSNYSKLYWLTRLDSIHVVAIAMLVVIFIGCLFAFIAAQTSFGDEDDLKPLLWVKRNLNKIIAVSALCFASLIFIPSKRDAIVIIAGGKTLDFAEQDSSLNKIPSQATKVISDYLNGQIEDLREKK